MATRSSTGGFPERGGAALPQGLRSTARLLHEPSASTPEEESPKQRHCFGRLCRRFRRFRRRLWRGFRNEVKGCCGKTVTGKALYFVFTRHPDQVRESMWNSMRGILDAWFAKDGGGAYAKRSKKQRRKGVQLAGKKSGAEGPGFGIHCFIINNSGDIDDFYQVHEEVNAGGSAQVFRAVELATKAVRAVKRIAKKSAGEIARVIQEVAIMKTLDHPNIVKLFETFEDDDYLYLVLEYCAGGDVLDNLLSNGIMDELAAAMVMRGMLSALNYLNANGYVHRDLKPENIMYKADSAESTVSQLRLVDFGYSCRAPDEGKALQTKVGSPYYVAPEVLSGSYGRECDIWSLGALCFMLLSGVPPFFGESDAETLRLVKAGRFVFPSSQWHGVSKGCKHFIRRCLQVELDKRLSVTEALDHPWLKHKFRGKVIHLRDETVERLVSFSQYHDLRRAAMLAVAFHMDAEDLHQLRELFRGLDLNGDGLLTTQEFSTGVRSLGVDAELLDEMIRCLDADHSGVIDYTEFLAATLEKPMYIDNHAVMLRAFRSFDQDDSGGLTAQEVAETIDLEESLEEVERIFEEVDVNRDGVMDYGEFYNMLKTEKVRTADAFGSHDAEGSMLEAQESAAGKAVSFGAEGEAASEESDQWDQEESEEEHEEEDSAEGGDEEGSDASEASSKGSPDGGDESAAGLEGQSPRAESPAGSAGSEEAET